jgi:hypothetical protein
MPKGLIRYSTERALEDTTRDRIWGKSAAALTDLQRHPGEHRRTGGRRRCACRSRST